MRLLQVATIPETLEAFLLPFARRFREQGWVVGAMARGVSRNERCRHYFDRLHDVGWSRNPLAPSNLASARAVAQVVAEGEYDLVHVHTPVAAFVTRFALRRRPRHVGVVYTAHGFHFHADGHPVTNAAFRSLERLAGPWTDELVVINREDEEAALRHRIVPAEQLHFVPGIGIDLAALDPAAVSEEQVRAVRDAMGVPVAAPLFLMLAEFTPNKRHEDALHALAGLESGAGRAPPHLAFAGTGPTMDRSRRLARELGLADRVHFLGFRRDAPVLVCAADALLLTSGREGLPRSVMEAMALGTPVVATDVRGVRDLVGGGHGLLVATGDVDALREALVHVIEYPREVLQMAERARVHVAAYDVQAVLDAYAALYAKMMDRQRAVGSSKVDGRSPTAGSLGRGVDSIGERR